MKVFIHSLICKLTKIRMHLKFILNINIVNLLASALYLLFTEEIIQQQEGHIAIPQVGMCPSHVTWQTYRE
jgi:hypothetical protein